MTHILATTPHVERRFAAFLFDMDGTLITSIASANRAWTRWATVHGIDPAYVLSIMHGVRSVDTMTRLGVADPAGEAARLTESEIEDTEGTEPISGALTLLAALPPERWAIATSAPRRLALARLAAAGIPVPAVLVTAEDVARGKPAPDCFLLAAERLGVAATECLVFEDTRAGLAAAAAAGAAAIAITATHAEPLDTDHPRLPDYQALGVRVDEDGLHLAPRETSIPA